VLLAALVACAAATLRAQSGGAPRPQSAGLRIVVIDGEDAVNIVQQRTATAPVVEVRDRNDQPVAGAIVRFAIRNGRATFSGARTLSVTTNTAGRAVAAGLTPTGTGTLQVTASVSFQGQTAAATIVQTNVMTAAEAASGAAGAGGGGGGGGFPTTLVAVAGGAAAGGLIAVDAIVPDFRGCGGGGGGLAGVFVDVTPISFDFSCEGGEPVFFDFGDGTPELPNGVPHVYRAPGTYKVTGTARQGDKRHLIHEQDITVITLTGAWRLASTGTILNLVQTGAQVTGTYALPSGSGTGAVSGTVQIQTPQVQLTLSGPPPGFLNANGSFDPNVLNTGGSGGGFPAGQSTLTKQ
jgi:hypothetical protein